MSRLRKTLIYTAGALAYMYVSTSLLLFHGPYPAVSSYIIDSLAVTRHAYLLRPLSLYTLSNAEISKHSVNWTTSTGVASTMASEDYSDIHDEAAPVIETEKHKTYTAQIVLVRDPKRVKVAITKYLGDKGQTVAEMTKEYHAILGVNGGGFNDSKWQGTGGVPVGTTMHDGKMIAYDQNSPVIAITANGQLLCGKYTRDELTSRDVREAVGFGPILVQDGNGVAPVDYDHNPRVAIGQKADGTMIFIVTSGRGVDGVNDMGATFTDVQNLMLKYGAVTAANLDGGSSAQLVYQDKLLNNPSDWLGARMVATAIVVQ